MSRAKKVFGPQLPATPQDRAVEGDRLMEEGFKPPWPTPKAKPATIKGSALATRVAGLLAKFAQAQATLATIDEQRAAAEATVEAVREEIVAIGLDSMSDLQGLDSRKDYRVCAHADCQMVDRYGYEETEGWLCTEHESAEAKERRLELQRQLYASIRAPAPTPAKEEVPF